MFKFVFCAIHFTERILAPSKQFVIPLDNIEGWVTLTVWDYDKFSADDVIAEVCILPAILN